MRVIIIFYIFVLSSCTYSYRINNPSSVQPGAVSNTSGLVYNDVESSSFSFFQYSGFEDPKVIGYALPSDTVIQAFFQTQMGERPFGYGTGRLYPGTVWVSNNLLMDEIEVPNIAWQEFIYYVNRDSSNYDLNLNPSEKALPREDYFTDPFFRLYPIVGVSYEQVSEYCKWRTKVANNQLQEYFQEHDVPKEQQFKVVYQLPTENEWETFAACGVDLENLPYGVKYVEAKVKVSKGAAQYFKYRNGLNESINQIQEDISAFNESRDEIIMFNIKREVPYFLDLRTPNYVFDLPVNNYGLYNIIGNVAEMVKEKGIAKGGSYLDSLEACKINDKIQFYEPAKNIGFRTVCEIIKVE